MTPEGFVTKWRCGPWYLSGVSNHSTYILLVFIFLYILAKEARQTGKRARNNGQKGAKSLRRAHVHSKVGFAKGTKRPGMENRHFHGCTATTPQVASAAVLAVLVE